MMRHPRSKNGFSLAEVLAVVCIVGIAAAVSVPAFSTLRAKSALRAAVGDIRALFALARSRAVARSRNVAVRFSNQQGMWVYAMYEDGDGDGVRNNDIAAGRDPLIRQGAVIASDRAAATIGFPAFPITDPDTGKALSPLGSPIKFNNSALCSFSAVGTATAGSIFLTNRFEDAVVVRVLGTTGRIRALQFDRKANRWR
jgi:prepilin-type N-terminal cleavage/methylation domain-containing protein